MTLYYWAFQRFHPNFCPLRLIFEVIFFFIFALFHFDYRDIVTSPFDVKFKSDSV